MSIKTRAWVREQLAKVFPNATSEQLDKSTKILNLIFLVLIVWLFGILAM